MLSKGLLFFTDFQWTVFGLMLFLGSFLGIFIWTYFRKNSQNYYGSIAQLPLLEENKHE